MARERVGLGDVRLHELRHTHASQAVMKGVPLPMVSKLLGHGQANMTLRYADPSRRILIRDGLARTLTTIRSFCRLRHSEVLDDLTAYFDIVPLV